MAERLIASVLKTEEGDNLSGGSNPSLPANHIDNLCVTVVMHTLPP